MSKTNKTKLILKRTLTGLPLGAVVWASFLSVPTWVHQALVMATLLWFYVFLLLDCFYLGG